MDGNRSAHVTAMLDRRLVIQAIACAGALTASFVPVRPRTTIAQDGTPEAEAGLESFAGVTYVGATSDPNTFVAIVAAEAEPGVMEQAARAYVCNGADVVEWLDEGGITGEGEGHLDLRSETGARMTATLSGETASGDITLPDGTELTFEAPRATGFDGLYTFTITPDGLAQGTSAEGARIEGQLLLSGAITLPDGESESIEWPILIDDTADLRTIYREESGRRGAGRTRKGVGLKAIP